MITLTTDIPRVDTPNAEFVKLRCLFEAYGDTAMFWKQDEGSAFISMIDGNMIIYNRSADISELAEFVNVISPACVFSDLDTLKAINRTPKEEIFVMHRYSDFRPTEKSDILNSRSLYDLLDVEGLSLPEYPYFAVDICRRLNHGLAKYFALEEKCAAVSFHTDGLAVMNGIASRQKGYGSIALENILAENFNKDFLVCCREKVKGFYEKFGFEVLYKAGYWVKNL